MNVSINWLPSRAQLTPHDTAIIDAKTNESWSYKEMKKRANLLTNYLLANGIQKGDRVALLSPNHISYFDLFFAASNIGAIFVPLNWRMSPYELDYILSDCQPKIVGVASIFMNQWRQLESNVNHFIIHSNDYVEQLDLVSESQHMNQLKERDPFAMIYTSGTTGQPKGVVLSHRSILWNAMNTIISWDLEQEDVTLTTLPMFHTGGLNAFSIPILLAGGTVVFQEEFEAEKAIQDLINYKCTTALFVPTMYHMMIQTELFWRSDFPHMKVFVSGGAPCPKKIYDAFARKGLAFKEGYGLTEAGPNNFYIDPLDIPEKLGSVGKPMIFNDIKIMKPNGDHAKSGEVGQLYVRGNHSFEFYWNQPNETKETFVDGWIDTGDLAKQDEDGFVYIVGRKKDMIITGGENVYPLEIEKWLEEHDAVNEAAVIGIDDDKWGEKVVAFISVKQSITIDELHNYCQHKLAQYKIPKQFHLIDELPKNSVGKIDKLALVERVR